MYTEQKNANDWIEELKTDFIFLLLLSVNIL